MSKLEGMTNQQYIFGALFVVANRVDTLLEREFKKFDITTKQWFLSVVIDNLFDCPPTIKEAAREMGSSHQNVKQVALKLEQKGLLVLEKDEKDSRATRLRLAENSVDFWKSLRAESADFMGALFKNISDEEKVAARSFLKKMLSNIAEMDKNEGGYKYD